MNETYTSKANEQRGRVVLIEWLRFQSDLFTFPTIGEGTLVLQAVVCFCLDENSFVVWVME